jgi:hypothetical protein
MLRTYCDSSMERKDPSFPYYMLEIFVSSHSFNRTHSLTKLDIVRMDINCMIFSLIRDAG